MTYLAEKIKEFSHEEIIYYDNDDVEQKIDLLECSKNWVEYFNECGDFITWSGDRAAAITVKENKFVGERDWFAEKPYFVFYSNPKIRFEIHPKKRFIDNFNKNWRYRYHKEFNKISLSLAEVGWCTFDLG